MLCNITLIVQFNAIYFFFLREFINFKNSSSKINKTNTLSINKRSAKTKDFELCRKEKQDKNRQ